MKLTLREIDVLVAEKVMGEDYVEKCKCDFPGCELCASYKAYPTDISAAWDVVGKFSSFYLSFDEATETWFAHLDFSRRAKEDCKGIGVGETAPHAICLAALKVFGESIEVIE